jgi:hypothetical protein
MNLFASDPDPVVSAAALADRHMKQALECAQMLSTVLRTAGLDAPYAPTGKGARAIAHGELYRAAYPHHPITRWAGATRGNFAWTIAHGLALCDELTRRFGSIHRSRPVIETAADLEATIPDGDLSPFAVDVPEAWREHVDMTGDPCAVYRSYLRAKYTAWGPAARWTRTSPPSWL